MAAGASDAYATARSTFKNGWVLEPSEIGRRAVAELVAARTGLTFRDSPRRVVKRTGYWDALYRRTRAANAQVHLRATGA
jgi:hypothetical protein